MAWSRTSTKGTAPSPLSFEVPVLTLRPHLGQAVILHAIYGALLIGLFNLALWYAGKLAGFAIIPTLFHALREGQEAIFTFSETMQSLGNLFFRATEELLTHLLVQGIAWMVIMLSLILNHQWSFYKDRMTYTTGFIFVRHQPLSYEEITNVYGKSYFPIIPFGRVCIQTFGKRDPIKLPCVPLLSKKVERIKEQMASYRRNKEESLLNRAAGASSAEREPQLERSLSSQAFQG